MKGAAPGFRFIIVSMTVIMMLLPGRAIPAQRRSLVTRPGVSVDVHVFKPENPFAVVVLFAGGPGRLNFSGDGFMITSHRQFTKKGLMVALLDAPSDQEDFRGGMSPRFRHSQAHVTDIDAVISSLKQESNLPLWIVGISMGTKSAVNYAVQRHKSIDGVVLLSSSTNPPRGPSVAEFGLERITVPVLAIAHKDDSCQGTPATGAKSLVDASTSSPRAKAIYLSGGRNLGRRPCAPRTHHTFYGIEDEVVSAIADFIKN